MLVAVGMGARVQVSEEVEILMMWPVQAGVQVEPFASQKQPHWKRGLDGFRDEELRRRSENSAALHPPCGELFFSQSQGEEHTDEVKRRVVAGVSRPTKEGGPGLLYSADCLKPSRGWRPEEVKGAIAACTKFVALIDEAWLSSFRCLQELVLALRHHKPAVLIVLSDRALTLASSSGARWAKAAADKNYLRNGCGFGDSLSIDRSDTEEVSVLCEYCGEAIVAGQPLSHGVMNDLFARLHAFKLCPLRERELTGKSWDQAFGPVLATIQKDLAYYVQHSELARLAARWEAAGCPECLLLPSRSDVGAWKSWLKRAQRARSEPAPTPLQLKFTERSAEHFRLLRRGLFISFIRWFPNNNRNNYAIENVVSSNTIVQE